MLLLRNLSHCIFCNFCSNFISLCNFLSTFTISVFLLSILITSLLFKQNYIPFTENHAQYSYIKIDFLLQKRESTLDFSFSNSQHNFIYNKLYSISIISLLRISQFVYFKSLHSLFITVTF